MDSAPLRNLLLETIEYRIDETAWGTWRRFLYPNGSRFEEFKSRAEFAGMPLFHYTYGICPETGRRVTARGVVAVGRFARGILAIGHVAFGIIAVGQASVGLVFGVGQATAGIFCLGQLAVGLIFGAGQVATGYIAIGQIAVGTYVLAQFGWGTHVIDVRATDPVAQKFFLRLIGK
jgi:hypothetical protein